MLTSLPYDPKKLFGQHLTRTRKAKGWSQEGLALDSGLARSYLSGVERGLRNIALVNICKLAHTMQITPSELLALPLTHTAPSAVNNGL